MKRPLCQHCNVNVANRARGLCYRCYYAPGVRDQYQPRCAAGRFGARDKGEPTMEEVEAMIAEQMRNLPDWWGTERRGE